MSPPDAEDENLLASLCPRPLRPRPSCSPLGIFTSSLVLSLPEPPCPRAFALYSPGHPPLHPSPTTVFYCSSSFCPFTQVSSKVTCFPKPTTESNPRPLQSHSWTWSCPFFSVAREPLPIHLLIDHLSPVEGQLLREAIFVCLVHCCVVRASNSAWHTVGPQ